MVRAKIPYQHYQKKQVSHVSIEIFVKLLILRLHIVIWRKKYFLKYFDLRWFQRISSKFKISMCTAVLDSVILLIYSLSLRIVQKLITDSTSKIWIWIKIKIVNDIYSSVFSYNYHLWRLKTKCLTFHLLCKIY